MQTGLTVSSWNDVNSPVFLTEIADQLEYSRPRAEQVLRAVLQALRDGLNDREASLIESSMPEDLRARWPKAAGSHPGLADLGDIGELPARVLQKFFGALDALFD